MSNLSVYNGPERSYPRKTFESGEKNPAIVREELLQIPQYLDYTVFSKNQLRFAERLFRTSTYIAQENYIRSENFFIKLDKPRYWNYDNVCVLFKNIRIVLEIVDEMFKDVVSDSNITVGKNSINAVTTIIGNLKKGFAESAIKQNDFINYLKGLSSSDSIDSIFFNKGYVDIVTDGPQGTKVKTGSFSINTAYIFAAQIVITIYAKVVSILTYINPYVLVKKDSGVNTITPPTLKNKNISIPRKERTVVEGKLSKFMDLDMTKYDENVEYEDQKLKSVTPRIKDSKTGTGKISREISNPYIRLIQFPCYSLNILLPITIAPVVFIYTEANYLDFKVVSSYIAEIKVIGSYFKINVNSFLSKLVFYDKDKNRCSPNLVFFKDANDNEKVKLKMKKGKKINSDYYGLLKAIAPQHAYYDGVIQQQSTVLQNYKAKELTPEEQNALTDAEKYIPSYAKDGTEKIRPGNRYHPDNTPTAKIYTYNDYVSPDKKTKSGNPSRVVPDSDTSEDRFKPFSPINKENRGRKRSKKVSDSEGNEITVYYYENYPGRYFDKQDKEVTMEVEEM